MPGATWRRLHELALAQHGFVTPQDARQVDVDPAYLRQMVERGTIEHVAYGLYRFPQVPVTELTPYMQAVLWVGEEAALSHDAVLAMHGLAFASPAVLRVTSPKRVRKSDPPGPIEIVRRQLPEADRTVYEGIPCTTVARALRDCRELIMPSRLIEAAHEARDRGLVRRRELPQLLEDLEDGDG